MATVKFSSIVSAVAGKIGGTVFARGANGPYIRTFSMPVNKNTQVLQTKRQNLGYYASKWRSLDDTDRQAWKDNAALFPYTNRVGDASHYTGFQWFMKTNMLLESAALEQ